MIEPQPYRTWVEISRQRLQANFKAVESSVGPGVVVMPVIKADAYRHGAVEVARVLEQAGAGWFAVSNTDEGIALRQANIKARILVMADALPFTLAAAIEHNLTVVIHSLSQLALLNQMGASAPAPVPFHLKVDTGMGRLGVVADAAVIASALAAAPFVALEGLMTHFASAANYQTDQTAEQISCFLEVTAALRELGIQPRYTHLASTIPVAYQRTAAWQTSHSIPMVRPGHAIYGYVSPARGLNRHSSLDVKPALTWRATVLEVKRIKAGDPVGYGAIFCAPRDMPIAILAAGYADGIPHRLSNRGTVLARGKFAPIIGAVSMDLTTIDVSAQPEVQVGDAVTLLGEEGGFEIDAQDIARTAGTISYSVLCGIHARVKRLYT